MVFPSWGNGKVLLIRPAMGLLALWLLALMGFWQSAAPAAGVRPHSEHVPRFSEYPARGVYRGRPARVDLQSNPDARRYRTRLREGARTGPNFAGHYTVVTWGCGTECQTLAILDAKTGRVYFAPFQLRLGEKHRLNSALLIANPPGAWKDVYGKELKNVPDGPPRTTYYRWNGRRLVLVTSVDPGKL